MTWQVSDYHKHDQDIHEFNCTDYGIITCNTSTLENNYVLH